MAVQAEESPEYTSASAVSVAPKFFSWSGTRGTETLREGRAEGFQMYVPVTGATAFEKAGVERWEFNVKSGYVYSGYKDTSFNTDYSGSLDTQVSATYKFLGTGYIQPFVGIAVNLPTGNSAIPVSKRLVRMDSDLVDVGSYGEGYDINPNIGFAFSPITNLTLTPSVGYAFRGNYKLETSIPSSVTTSGSTITTVIIKDAVGTITPGDTATASISASYAVKDLGIATTLAYSSYSDIELNGVVQARQGASYSASSTLNYQVSPELKVMLNGTWAYNEKSQLAVAGQLFTEARNSGSNVFAGSIHPKYLVDKDTHVGAYYAVLHRDENFYNVVESQYLPAKTKQQVGLTLDLPVTSKLDLAFDVSRYWVGQDDGTKFSGVGTPPELSYTGWSGQVSTTVKF